MLVETKNEASTPIQLLTITATYADLDAAKRVKEVLTRAITKMEMPINSYLHKSRQLRIDNLDCEILLAFQPPLEFVDVHRDHDTISLGIRMRKRLDCERLLTHAARPLTITETAYFQKTTIFLFLPKQTTKKIATLIIAPDEIEAIDELNKLCGKPSVYRSLDDESNVMVWKHVGEPLYLEGRRKILLLPNHHFNIRKKPWWKIQTKPLLTCPNRDV